MIKKKNFMTSQILTTSPRHSTSKEQGKIIDSDIKLELI